MPSLVQSDDSHSLIDIAKWSFGHGNVKQVTQGSIALKRMEIE